MVQLNVQRGQMKIDLFENKYKPNSAVKIFFADLVCFLVIAMLTIGLCHAYFSDKTDVRGSASTAKVGVEYQYNLGGGYASQNEVYVKLNNSTTAQSLSGVVLTPGDKITILGRIVSKSNVSVYILARLEIETIQKGEAKTEVVWFNIGSNDPELDGDGNEISSAIHTSSALQESEYKQLQYKQLTNGTETHNVCQVGAGSLGAYKYKDLAIPYTFDGEKYVNNDSITSVKFSLHAHQKEHLNTASDFDLYKQYESQITGYDIESIYAVHYITGTQLTRQ